MLIPLNEFEHHIEEKILKRGLSYYKNGNVIDVQELFENHFEASVEGSDNYIVQVEIEDQHLADYSCDCPYDMGPICKHVVATLFYLVEIELDGDFIDVKPKTQVKKKTKKKKTVKEDVQNVLEKVSFEELKTFIEKKAINDTSFRNSFFAFFAPINDDESKELYQRQIKSILNAGSDRSGFIDWSAVRRVGREIYCFLNLAREHLKKGNYQSVFFMAAVALEELTAALQYTDDSNGDIGNNIYVAIDLLMQLGAEQLTEKLRKTCFEYYIHAYKKEIYYGWDWHFSMIELATKATQTEEEANLLLNVLDANTYKAWELQQVQILKYEIIQKQKGTKKANAYLKEHLKNPTLRTTAIQNAFNKGAYETAIAYAKDGILQDEKDAPGYVSKWYQWLLKIAEKQRNKDQVIKYARYLFISNYNYQENLYRLLKQHVSQKEWHSFVEIMLSEIYQNHKWRVRHLVPEIYIAEKWWSRLMTYVEKETDLEVIEQYEKYLKKDYAENLIQLYINMLTLLLERNTGRNYYQKACRYLRRVKKLGGEAVVKERIEFFRNAYPKRRALMDELKRV